jgi:hypothetical protein
MSNVNLSSFLLLKFVFLIRCRFNEYMTNTRSSQTKSSELDSVTYVQSETHPLLRTPSPHGFIFIFVNKSYSFFR